MFADDGDLASGEMKSNDATELVCFDDLFPPDAPATESPLAKPNPPAGGGTGQLVLAYRGEMFVFDSVRPDSVQKVLLMLGGQEVSTGVTNEITPFQVSNNVSQSFNNPHRIASLKRYREKRKNLCFGKRTQYSIRSEVASRLKRHKGQFVSSKASFEDAASAIPSVGGAESNCQVEKELPAFCQKCGTSKSATPMMRCEPAGPRSLCNACGLMWSIKGTLKDLP